MRFLGAIGQGRAHLPPTASGRSGRKPSRSRPLRAGIRWQLAGASVPPRRKIADEKGVDIDLASVEGTGPKGNVTKGDVLAAASYRLPAPESLPRQHHAAPALQAPSAGGREERVKMTRLSKRIAERLKEAQNTAAMLTTFNEVDMSAVMDLRKRYQDSFVKKHGIKLGFMSFFVKACVDALQVPILRSMPRSTVTRSSTSTSTISASPSARPRAWWCRWSVVPTSSVLAGIEQAIADLGTQARDGKLSMDELMGGTFTITNGGIFGSMMSTPILNPPQVGILGMHNIVQRAMVMPDGSIAARPMMYLALSYDHRIIDGKEAVSFLVRVKQCIEDPQRMLIDA